MNSLLSFLILSPFVGHANVSYPAGFVSLEAVAPSISIDMRYVGSHNFVGVPVRGYLAPKCILTERTARALAAVQEELKSQNLGLKVYDCYRPQRAVDHFVAWASDLSDVKMKKEFYFNVAKEHLFRDGYIASKSGHSRGSTVDLTLVSLSSGQDPAYNGPLMECFKPVGTRWHDNSVDMGTEYDCFDVLSHTLNPNISAPQRQARLLLKSLMEKHGFRGLAEEWWHFTLNDEPYPKTYFDFEVK